MAHHRGRSACCGRGWFPGRWARAMRDDAGVRQSVERFRSFVWGFVAGFCAGSFKNTRKPAHIDRAIRFSVRGAARMRDPKRRASHLSNASQYLAQRYLAFGDATDLDNAVGLGTEALELTRSHPDRWMYLNDLAIRLGERYDARGDRADLERALRLLDEALGLLPPGGDRAKLQLNRSRWLASRHQVTGDRADLDDAVVAAGEALMLAPMATDRAAYLDNLALRLAERHDARGALQDVDEAVRLTTEAADLAAGTSEWGRLLGNLALHLGTRYEATSTMQDLDAAIAQGSEAVRLTPAGPNRAVFLENHANRLMDRFRALGDPVDLDHAVAALEEALDHAPSGPARVRTLNDLANQLSERHQLGGDLGDLDRSVLAAEEALSAGTSGPIGATLLNGLAGRLSDRFEVTGDPDDLERGVALARKALDLTPEGPSRAYFLTRLATLLKQRIDLVAELSVSDLDEVIDLEREALRLVRDGHRVSFVARYNLALSLFRRWEAAGDDADLRLAVACLEPVARQRSDLREAASAGRLLCRSRAKHGSTEFAGWGATRAVAAIRDLTRIAVSPAQRSALLDALRGLGPQGAAALIDTGQPDEAVLLLEAATAIQLAQASALAGIGGDLEVLTAHGHNDLAARLAAAVAALASSQSPAQLEVGNEDSAGDGPDVERRVRGDYDRARRAVNALADADPQLAARLSPAIREITLEDVRAVCRRLGGPIVYVAATEEEGFALIVGPDSPSIEVVRLPHLASETILHLHARNTEAVERCQTAVAGYLALTHLKPRSGLRSRALQAVRDAEAQLADLMVDYIDRTTNAVTAPLLEVIGAPRVITLIPLGLVGYLPIPASVVVGTGGATNVTVAPNVHCLTAAPPPILSDGVVVVAHPGTPPLPCAWLEAANVARAHTWTRIRPTEFESVQTGADDAGSPAVVRLRTNPVRPTGPEPPESGELVRAAKAELAVADVVHFICHGHQSPEEPSESALLLDSPLTVAAIEQLELTNRPHVVLSACDTGLIGRVLPEEHVGLPAALLQAGAGSVLAALWPVDDAATAEFMGDYHRRLAASGDPARALAGTQRQWHLEGREPLHWAAWVLTGRAGPTGIAR